MTEQQMDKLSKALDRIEARIDKTNKLMDKLYEAILGKDGDKDKNTIPSQGIILLDGNRNTTTTMTYDVDPEVRYNTLK